MNMKTFLNIKLLSVTALILPMMLLSGCKDQSTGITDEPDIDAPEVASTSPTNNETEVERNKVIEITFNEEMDTATINSTTFTISEGSANINGSVAYSGTTATFTSENSLTAVTDYTATLTTGAKSAKGIALAADKVWSFTTADNDDPEPTAPTVASTSPSSDETDVERNKIIEITFNEEMDAATINSTTFTVSEGSANINGSVAYSGMTATFTAENSLTAVSDYTATVTTGAKSSTGVALAADKVWSFTTSGSTTPRAIVDLGTAGNYVVLAKSAINNNPTSDFTGDLGLSPAAESYYTGFSQTANTGYSTSDQVTGQMYAADMTDPTPSNLTTAVSDMTTAYNDAAGRTTPDFVELYTGEIGGKTLTPGLYKWSNTVLVASDVTISGGADDVWIFQIAENLTMSSAVNITLSGGAQAKNIFWQVAGEVTIGTTSHFEGVILSQTGITLNTGATLNGRTLAQTSAIFDGNTVVEPAQ